MLTRRNFHGGLASLAFGGLALASCARLRQFPDLAQRVPGFGTRSMRIPLYGPLSPSPNCPLIDLPAGFTCEVVSKRGQVMEGGEVVPDHADGMGCFVVDASHVALVRNHEISDPQVGGTTTIVYDYKAGVPRKQYRSLGGTMTNCAGGATPWGTWLSCEEEDLTPGHGYVYEVPALADGRTVRRPLTQLGRFNHEAAAVDTVTNTIYMTEDQIDGLFYRFVPGSKDDSLGEGQLQALVLDADEPPVDVRNWGGRGWKVGDTLRVHWVPLEGFDRPLDDPRKRAHRALKAIRFACGEGIHFGREELYFTCTSGGRIKSGQIMRYTPDRNDERRGSLQLFVESTEEHDFNFADNLAVAPNGHLIVCEDPYFGGEKNYLLREAADLLGMSPAPCYLRGVTPEGEVYDLARLRGGSELAGVCFSPGGEVMFVNIYSPATTLAIKGDWKPVMPADWQPFAASAAGRAALP
ncbi:MAG TPA: alkaline phosphatase PhoX [Allosphingosinicella sp.]|nr:alkaline phosphatase PhoX [Allosphingosinicella sp.]